MNKKNCCKLEMNMMITEMYSKNNPKKQKIYTIIVGILIFLPVIISSVIGVLVEENTIIYIVLCFLLCWGILGLLTVIRKKIIIKKYIKLTMHK